MKKKRILIALLCVLAAIPAFAVFNEKDITQTLSVLRFELSQQNAKMENSRSRIRQRNERQHRMMVDMIKKCNELSLILYSQNQDYTFDLAYALNAVTDNYEAFSKRRMPYDEIVSSMNLEIERYQRLIEALRRIPPVLDEIDVVPDSIRISKEDLMSDYMPSGTSRPKREAQDDTAALDVDSLRSLDPIPVVSDSLLAQFGIIRSRQVPDGTLESDGHDHGHGSHDHGHAHAPVEAMVAPGDTASDGTPFMLDEEGREDREACLMYALSLLEMYTEARDRIVADNDHYVDLSNRLEEAYNYAQARYKVIQKRIFVDGQDDYFSVLRRFGRYSKLAVQDTRQKYMSALVEADHHDAHGDHGHHHHNESEWRGPVVAGFAVYIFFYLLFSLVLSAAILYLLSKTVKAFTNEEFKRRRFGFIFLFASVIFAVSIMIASQFVEQNFIRAASKHLLVYAWLLAAISASLLIRVKPEDLNRSFLMYTPVMLLGLAVITFRIIFIPNRLVNLIFPPLLLIFFVWQLLLCLKHHNNLDKRDAIYSWITCVVFGATAVMAWAGYVLLGVQVVIWWLFQLAAIETVTAIYDLLKIYSESIIARRKQRYLQNHQILDEEKTGAFIMVTWFFDFLRKAVLPILAVLSIPLCINMAAKVFDLSEICKEIFFKPFFNLSDTKGNPILHLSLYKLVLVTSLFYLFKYIDYLAKALYRHDKLQKAMAKNEGSFVHANQVNLTLANNVISILVWGTYIVACINLLKIPMGALSIVAAGLATGLGLAMKDVLNNFIYGIQLMAGRVRVGDYIECDGVRGQVESITHQSTQIATLEGDIMAFTNTTLFNKNFRNLTKDNPYVFSKIPVGVSYGTDVETARKVILEALEPFKKERDKYGRRLIGKRYGIQVTVEGFGDSSVDLAVKEFLLVESQLATAARMREVIYQALAENGITIPFPQQDIYIKEYPSKENTNQ